MKLLVDVGNTTINLGLANEDRLVDTWRLHTNKELTVDELWDRWESLLGDSLESHLRLTVASVVPELSRTIRQLSGEYLEHPPEFLESPWSTSEVSVNTDRSDEVGPDRVAGAEAMIRLYGGGIVVDFGTATTVDYVNETGAYEGGVIIPGVRASSRGLASETALLPPISPGDPDGFRYKNTRDALRTGLIYGMAGSVERIIREFIQDGAPADSSVVATGGGAELFLDAIPAITNHAPNLVLRGLNFISNHGRN